MSIYARKYKPSKWEPIIFADKLDDMFTDFAARDFGIKDLKTMLRHKYAVAPLDVDDFSQMIDLFEKLFRKNVVIQKHKLIITEAV